jgi:S-DNA-T family DNA segregation ATPase FtsK/SpoIIIE
MSYFTLGFSVWWCFAAGVRAWMALAGALDARAQPVPAPQPAALQPYGAHGFLGGPGGAVVASTALEWSRLYRFEPRLPGHAGWRAGLSVGPAGVQWLGFTGSGLSGIALPVLGAALVFRFSWGQRGRALGGVD